jgi:hypothetical protein
MTDPFPQIPFFTGQTAIFFNPLNLSRFLPDQGRVFKLQPIFYLIQGVKSEAKGFH